MNAIDRRKFLRGVGAIGLGSATYTLISPAGSWAASTDSNIVRRSLKTMGTMGTITIMGEKESRAKMAARIAFEEVRHIEYLMSTHRQFSQLSRVNTAAGNDAMAVDSRVLDVMRASLAWGDATGGMFDVTTLPLLKAWGYREGDGRGTEAAQAARESIGYRQIRIENDLLGLMHKGAGIDLGGIAKGYAVDRAAEILRDRCGIENAIVEIGGDLRVVGKPTDDTGWNIGVKDPFGPGLIATVKIADAALATSGDYTRSTTTEGRVHGDSINPFTGEPTQTFAGTTAWAKTAMDADAASTTIHAAGLGADMKLAAGRAELLNITGSANAPEIKTTPGFPSYEQV